MRGDSRFMLSVTTALGAIAAVTLVPTDNTAQVMAATNAPYIAVDDTFSVDAGKSEPLNVLANDVNVGDGDMNRMLIVQQPICGAVRRVEGELEYFDSSNCSGRMSFTYCVIQGDSCPSARVTLSVTEAVARGNGLNVGAETTQSSRSGFNPGFARIQAPQLAAPSVVTGITAAEATASLRQRPDGGIRLRAPNFTASIGIGRPRIADMSPGDTAAAIPLPRIAVSNNNSASPFIATSAPRIAAPTVAPSRLGAAPDASGSEAAPQIASAGLGDTEIAGGREIASRALRAVSSIFRPSASASSSPEADAAPRIASSSRPDSSIVPQRAAQAIVGTPEPSAPALRPALKSDDTQTIALLPAQNTAAPLAPATTVAKGTCDVTTLATGSLGGTISFSAVSHCRPNMVATIAHEGIEFDMTSDADGRIALDIPALSQSSDVSVTFADGTSDSVNVRGVRLGNISRVAVSWDGSVDLYLSALEFGATEGGEGHIWRDEPSSYRNARRNGGGYLVELGDGSGKMAEVYTMPVSSRTPAGTVELELNVADGSKFCGEDIRLNMVRLEDGPFATDSRAVIRVDQCGEGDIVKYSSVIKDLNFARR